MKTHYTNLLSLLQSRAYGISVILLSAFFITASVSAVAQENEKKEVKVKIIKIVDGDTTITEKTYDPSEKGAHHKFFMDEDGKKFKMRIESDEDGTHHAHRQKMRHHGPMKFKFDMDSTGGHAFAKCFMLSDSAFCKKGFTWNDSCMKMCMKDFKFDFESMEKMMEDFGIDVETSDDNKKVTIKTSKGKTIVIDRDEDVKVERSEDGKTKTKVKSFIVENEKGGKKKVVITTAVTVLEEDGSETDRVKDGQPASSFSFYPNPNDGNFMLDLDLNGKKPAQVTITDIAGKEIYNEKISGKGKVSHKIALDGKKGTFIVTVKQGGKTQSKKIIIE